MVLDVYKRQYQDRKIKDVRGSDMEKVKFAFADGNGEDEFFILEETKINGSAYILVAESEDDDCLLYTSRCV